jgi:uncharacterized protein (DUF488 family)
MTQSVFTVGHSTHELERFVGLLTANAISAIADVRSSPYSRVNPQFNRESLTRALRENGIAYVFLGKELGARSDDPKCYRGGKVQYELLAETELFKQGLQRLLGGAEKYRLALMCAEKDPLDCHRAILVGKALLELEVSVNHILADGRIESHDQLVERMLRKWKLSSGDMFSAKEQFVAEAYRKQGEAIAYEDESLAGSANGRGSGGRLGEAEH